ncbi:hypothetical protein HID58_049290, partial [Brassica napus]
IFSAVHWSRVVWSLELLDDIELVVKASTIPSSPLSTCVDMNVYLLKDLSLNRRKYHELKVKDERPFGISKNVSRHCQSSQSSMAKEANNGDLLQFRVNPCPCWSHNIPLDSSAIASSFFYAASHSYWDYGLLTVLDLYRLLLLMQNM